MIHQQFIRKGIILLIVLFLVSKQGVAQQFPLKISILDESISVPNLWFANYSYHPTVIIGTEYVLQERGKHDWHLAGNLGYFYHKGWESAIFLTTEIAYRYHLGRWNISPKLGLGYAHTFSTQPVYSYRNGNFEKVTDYGNPTFMPSLSLNIGFKLANKQQSPEVFLTFMESAEIPFNTFTGLHQFVGLGYKFYPFFKP